MSSLYGPLFSSAAMRAVVADSARLQRMLDVESALARAEAAAGSIPAQAAAVIADCCHANLFSVAAIGEDARAGGNITIPLVKALTAKVTAADADAGKYVHWGATSQDIIDTALVLELRAAVDALMPDLERAIAGFSDLADTHRNTMTVARTLMQHALPMPFGLKLAGYAAALSRARERLRALRTDHLVLQFGGAAGTLAALGDKGLAVSETLAALLHLPLPDAPWHTHRDRLAEIAATFAILTATCGKIARDVSLLMQTEIGEAAEPAAEGRGGSSTMPQKRNPVGAVQALSCAAIAPNLAATIIAAGVQEHERGAGGWQAEWPVFPALELVTSGALAAAADMAEGLDVDGDRMGVNLAMTKGAVMAEAVSFALAAKIGKHDAHKLIAKASREAASQGRSLHDILAKDPAVTKHIGAKDLAAVFDPTTYQGAAREFIDRQIASAARHAKPTKR